MKSILTLLLVVAATPCARLRSIRNRNARYVNYRGHYRGNRLSQNHYNTYRELHRLFKPITQLYGRHLKSKIVAAKKRGTRLAASDEFLLHSMFSQSAQCAFHTLGFHN